MKPFPKFVPKLPKLLPPDFDFQEQPGLEESPLLHDDTLEFPSTFDLRTPNKNPPITLPTNKKFLPDSFKPTDPPNRPYSTSTSLWKKSLQKCREKYCSSIDYEIPKYYSDRNILDPLVVGGKGGTCRAGEGFMETGKGFSSFLEKVCKKTKAVGNGSGLRKSILKSVDRNKCDSIGSLESSRISESSVGGSSEKKVRFLRQARESKNKNKNGLGLFDNYLSGINKSMKKSEGVFLKCGQ
jgi:hypothetical protein